MVFSLQAKQINIVSQEQCSFISGRCLNDAPCGLSIFMSAGIPLPPDVWNWDLI